MNTEIKNIFTTTPPLELQEYAQRQRKRLYALWGSVYGLVPSGSYFANSIIENNPLPVKILYGAATVIFAAGGITMHTLRRKAKRNLEKEIFSG